MPMLKLSYDPQHLQPFSYQAGPQRICKKHERWALKTVYRANQQQASLGLTARSVALQTISKKGLNLLRSGEKRICDGPGCA